MGTKEITIPKTTDASMSPRRIVHTATGQDASRSRVLAWVSQGAITGATAVAVKKTAIPSRPGIKEFTGICLPIKNARKRNVGMSTPKMTTGPLT
jgi:hypothetical protein